MPGMDGMQATRKLSDTYPGLLVIMLTMFKGEEHLREARRAGASAYILKDAGSDLLLQTIRDVVSGGIPLLQENQEPAAPALSSLPTDHVYSTGTDELLTAKERTILKLLSTGHTNDQISSQTGLSETMVRTYLAEIYRKLGLPGREEAARYAHEHGIAQE
jgi:DNA-binding NarL/FixJ family response regulator